MNFRHRPFAATHGEADRRAFLMQELGLRRYTQVRQHRERHVRQRNAKFRPLTAAVAPVSTAASTANAAW